MKLGEGVAELELERKNCVKKQCLEREKRKNVGYKSDERKDRRGGGREKVNTSSLEKFHKKNLNLQ